MRAGYDELAQHRQLRLEAYKERWGRFHPAGDAKKRHLNLVRRFTDVLIPHIVTYNPDHDVEPRYAALAGEAALTGMYLNHLGQVLNRRKVMRAALQDAFLGPKAIVRFGLRAGSELVKIRGRSYYPGQPYMRLVPFDDWVVDPAARCREEVRWEGEYYRVPRALALECGLFNPAVIERAPGLADGGARRGTRDSDRLDEQGKVTSAVDRYALEDLIELLDVCLYDENGEAYIVTMTAEEMEDDDDFLRIEPYEGPARGPYEWLEFLPDNGQLHGTPPVSAVREQAEAFYAITNKMIEDIEETKRILAADKSVSDDELGEIEASPNGAIVRVQDPRGLQMLEFGGTADIYTAAAGIIYNWFNISSANSDLLSGTGTDTDKATIFQGLQANANAIVEDYQEIHQEFEEAASRHLAWWGLSDPFLNLPMTHRMPGGELIQVHFNAASRRGEYADFTYRIVPRSTMRQDPQVKMHNVLSLLEIVLKAAEVDAVTGYIDVTGVARLGGRLLDIREMQQIVRDALLNQQLGMQMALTPGPVRGQPIGATPGLNQQATSYRYRLVGESGEPPKTRMGATRSAASSGVRMGA